jgi:hypothetical protein
LSVVLPTKRPVVLALFASGGSGENRDFDMVSGQGPVPGGPVLRRGFERSDSIWGLTASGSPAGELSLFASYFEARDAQDYDLALSNLQRTLQDLVPISFAAADLADYSDVQRSLIVGGRQPLGERSEIGLAVSWTRAQIRYAPTLFSPQLASVAATSVVDSDIPGVDLELGHELRTGLRVLVGYRLQLLVDDAPLPQSVGSVVPPFDLSETRHTLMLGVTLTSDLLRADPEE